MLCPTGLRLCDAGEALQATGCEPLQAEVARRGRFMARFHRDTLTPALAAPDSPFNGVSIDLNGLGWALGACTSRAFATRGPRKPRALLPLIDMCNHSFGANCDIQMRKDGGVELVATRMLPAGQQLLLNYGAMDSHTYLLDYGFVDHENPHDHVLIHVTPDTALVRSGLRATQAHSCVNCTGKFNLRQSKCTPYCTANVRFAP